MPAFTVVIPCSAHDDPTPAITSLRLQTFQDWNAIVSGECPAHARRLAAGDARFSWLECPAPSFWERTNAGIGQARGHHLTVIDPQDRFEPEGLDLLRRSLDRSGLPGAYGEFRFTSPLGQMPGCPLTGGNGEPPKEVGLDDLLECKLFPLHAMAVRRECVPDHPFPRDPGLGGDHEMLLSLARHGVRWGFARGRVAAVTMEPPRGLAEIETELIAHLEVIAKAAPDPCSAAASLLEAIVLLRWAREETAGLAEDEIHRLLAERVRFPDLFARWWQRCRYLGRPPRHVLHASGSMLAPPPASPARTARALLEACTPGRPIVLLGLGRNARYIAAEMQRRGLAVTGRDDALTAPPAWALAEGIDVRVLPPNAPWGTEAQYIMTITDDRAYLARLPEEIRPCRWADAPAHLMLAMVLCASRDLGVPFHPPRPRAHGSQPSTAGAAP